ncbi:MAG: nuclear transport factor 2 family protein [Candidatus Sulfotelmatobacter sp.]
MRRILLLPLLTVALLGFARAQATVRNQPDADTEKEVLEVERQKDEAVRNRDIAVLERIYADDMAFVNGRGQVVSKAQHLEEIRAGNVKYLSSNKSDYHVRLYGSTAILTGRENSVVEYHGKTISSPRQFITVYVKLDGQWKYVAHQVTPVAEQ